MANEITLAKISHLEDIIKLWGGNRATLGLMPRDAFIDSIKKNWVIIAREDGFVTAYLLFRFTNRNQTLSIVHLCVDKDSRGKGLSSKLIDKLVELYKSSARGIKLSCRSDYLHAIEFWKRYNFQPKGRQPSRGSNQNVHLIIWWFSFGKNDLFSYIETDKIKAVLDFNIIAKLRDLNINDDCYEEVAHLQNDYLVSDVEYFQTSETISEIFRDQNQERKNRSTAFIRNFPELNIHKPSINDLEIQLQGIISGTSDNDRSDRRQIAEAILSGFPYFITLDEGILKNKAHIKDKYQLKVLKPSSLFLEIDVSTNAIDYFPSKLSGSNFSIKKATADESDILSSFFLKHGDGEKKNDFSICISLILKNTGTLLLINEGNDQVGLVGHYDKDNMVMVPLLRTKQYNLRQTIFMQNTYDLINHAIKRNKEFIIVTDKFLTPIEISILESYGFYPHKKGYIKGVYNKICPIQNLESELSDAVKHIPQLSLALTKFKDELSETAIILNTYFLERQLWPLKVMDTEIPCFIIPIKPAYARELFDAKAAKQDLFGSQPQLIWNKENVYYRNLKPNIEKFPARILWYASQDGQSSRQMSLVCSSYLDEIIIGPAKDLFKKYDKFGVYSWDKHIKPLAQNDPYKDIKILRFSNSEPFENVVTYKKIKEILKSRGEKDNNFQSPLRITASTYIELYCIGKGIKLNNE
ncbi:GNAT family N-acetyltransferase [Chitinophaga oryziterrae]|uniref:GNAT family N-acetyltransferase n=1 Tax=Chitinophaga oryziterrae TaxID=1031224 RepID=A0A6N8JKE3_9BACT|nr:GNAT family N-acetyltransferase [Chitinophaga oryziterrae]MVT44849.1 GNAT family N-acetyltransferase [Chitinophaga oryziterrae]